MKFITIKNANVHNIRNLDIMIPKNKLVTIAGVSGSGKSTIAYDILYRKSMNEYFKYRDIVSDTLELSTCDEIIGLSPVIAVQQNTIRQANPKSVIGTKIKLFENLKQLYLLEGHRICPNCNTEVLNQEKCPNCQSSLTMVTKRHLSFNSPEGMCLECQGRGHKTEYHMENILGGDEDTLHDICKRLKISVLIKSLSRFTDYYDMDPKKVKFSELDRKKRNQFLYGFKNDKLAYGTYWGVMPAIENAYRKGTLIPNIANEEKCPCCQGYKLGEEGRSLKFMGLHIGEMQSLCVTELKDLLICACKEYIRSENSLILIKNIVEKLDRMIKFDIGYLSLSREIPSLSGGELHKLFLMQHMDMRMDSMIYIFDEPTSGLHKIERDKFISWLKKLRDEGNSVIVVEHDLDMINASDYILEIGPGAGEKGGKIIYAGDSEAIKTSQDSILSRYVNVKKTYRNKEINEIDENTRYIQMNDVSTNNLKHISVQIPLNRVVGVAGASGSGKSSLISNTLVPILKFYFGENSRDEMDDDSNTTIKNENDYIEKTWESVRGLEYLTGFSQVDQRPIAKNCRSNLLTYLDLWAFIRELYEKEAAENGKNLTAAHFSFNSEGACECCKGLGFIERRNAGMVYEEVCGECNGKRYHKDVLSVKYSGKSITDILDMSVTEALGFFRKFEKLFRSFSMLEKMGLGYLKLGQPISTFSGGECQRLKLIKQLLKKQKGNMLYILDEPSSGLGVSDVEDLLKILDQIVKEGNSVILIEHNLEVLSWCDYLIELGPNSGEHGGEIIAMGSPIELKKSSQSIIGAYLEEWKEV